MDWLLTRTPAPTVYKEALRWVEDVKGGTAQDPALLEWITRSPRHTEEFLRVWSDWETVAALTPERRAKIEALVAQRKAEGGPLRRIIALPWAYVHERKTKPSAWAFWKGARITALAMMAPVLLTVATTQPVFTTGKSERRVIHLSDGSVVNLAPDTRVRISFDGFLREIDLQKGEAVFDVARDARRRLRVRTETAAVDVIGTRFLLRYRPDHLHVSVLEGRVRVIGYALDQTTARGLATLTAGQELAVMRKSGRLSMSASVFDTGERFDALMRTFGRLTFKGERLDRAIQLINAHNRTQIVIDDASIGAFRVSGLVVPDVDTFVSAFERGFPFEVVNVPSEPGARIHFRARPTTPAPSGDRGAIR